MSHHPTVEVHEKKAVLRAPNGSRLFLTALSRTSPRHALSAVLLSARSCAGFCHGLSAEVDELIGAQERLSVFRPWEVAQDGFTGLEKGHGLAEFLGGGVAEQSVLVNGPDFLTGVLDVVDTLGEAFGLVIEPSAVQDKKLL